MSETDCLLQSVQVLALQNPSTTLFQQERDLHNKWIFLRGIGESFYKQNSRVNWLKKEDQNTTYFQRMTQVRNFLNSIRSFLLPSGSLITDQMDMTAHAISFFKYILAPDYLALLVMPLNWIQSLSLLFFSN